MTEAVHDLIGAHFTNLHGPLAGWSTSVLFVAELKHLKAPKTVNELLEKNWSKKKKKKRELEVGGRMDSGTGKTKRSKL